jgi:SAM-dependent methyltransferase
VTELRRQIAAHYSAQAESFAAHWAPVLRDMSTALLLELPLAEARRVLDIGCGTGGLFPGLRRAAPRAQVVGVDLSEGMLAVARRTSNALLIAGAAEQLPLRSGTIDAAVLSFVLHRLPAPAAALAEAARVLRRDRAIGIAAWGIGGGAGQAERIWRDEVDALGLPREPSAPAFYDATDSPAKIEGALLAAGFVDARAWRRTFERRSSPEEWLTFQVERRERARLSRLEPARRLDLVQRVRERVRSLPPAEFASWSEAVFGLGYTYVTTGRR